MDKPQFDTNDEYATEVEDATKAELKKKIKKIAIIGAALVGLTAVTVVVVKSKSNPLPEITE